MAAIDPATGTILDGIEVQTEQALLNVAAVLAAAASSMDGMVKTTILVIAEASDRHPLVAAWHGEEQLG